MNQKAEYAKQKKMSIPESARDTPGGSDYMEWWKLPQGVGDFSFKNKSTASSIGGIFSTGIWSNVDAIKCWNYSTNIHCI